MIYDGKFKPFENVYILKMIGVYMFENSQLTAMISLPTASAMGKTNCTIPSVTSLVAKIH